MKKIEMKMCTQATCSLVPRPHLAACFTAMEKNTAVKKVARVRGYRQACSPPHEPNRGFKCGVLCRTLFEQ